MKERKVFFQKVDIKFIIHATFHNGKYLIHFTT